MASRGVLVVAGTRPEAIKLAPVVLGLRARGIATVFCGTGQHRELFAEALAPFDLAPDIDLGLMRPDQSVDAFLAVALPALSRVMRNERPQLAIVQGDTATAFAGALAAFYCRVPLAHVEAGLRSGDFADPFPEELHRIQIARMAVLHFAPTQAAVEALRHEGVPADRIHQTGNTGIDALCRMLAFLDDNPDHAEAMWQRIGGRPTEPLVLVTIHRRESHGAPLEQIVAAIRTLAQAGGIEIVIPMHPHPAVRSTMEAELGKQRNVRLIEPLPYPDFIACLRAAHLVLTDSGGVQEEAPMLGVPALVLRRTTERTEGLGSGNARLIGTEIDAIVTHVRAILDAPEVRSRMAEPMALYGDGDASRRVVDVVSRTLGLRAAVAA